MRKDYKLEKRKFVIGAIIIAVVVIYVIKLFELQVSDSKYKDYADSNAFLRKTIYPSRGLMYDRNGKLIVFNQPAYDLVFIILIYYVKSKLCTFCQLISCNTSAINISVNSQLYHLYHFLQ